MALRAKFRTFMGTDGNPKKIVEMREVIKISILDKWVIELSRAIYSMVCFALRFHTHR